jgi:hypothetical protein
MARVETPNGEPAAKLDGRFGGGGISGWDPAVVEKEGAADSCAA